ncbi:MAG TPA: MMPL family transporter [Gaiellaceae bacterium]|nr:MMPL family transporter [Gaiellaceae bacterium]
MNLAERAGRWSAAHWKTATIGWIVLVAAAVLIGSAVGTKSLSDAEQSTGETARAEQMLDQAHFNDPAREAVIVQSTSLNPHDPAFRRTVGSVLTALKRRPEVMRLRSPYAPGNGGQISKDGHSALVQFDMRGDPDSAADRVQPVLDAVAAVQKSNPAFTIQELGDASGEHEIDDTVGKDFTRAEHLSLPITFLILLGAFGAFVAAGIPVLLALSAVLGSIGLSSIVSHVAHASDTTNSVILLMGMAVGVDYSLFYLKREREERRRGLPGREALHRAAATSGQAVLVSGGTVLIAMAGMLLAGNKIFTSLGIGAMLVILVSMIGSVTVLPALLGKLEDRVDRGLVAVLAAGFGRLLPRRARSSRALTWLTTRRTLLQRVKGDRSDSRLWNVALRPALRFPVAAATVSAAVLVVLALPAFGIHTKLPGISDENDKLAVAQTYDRIQAAFPGSTLPADVIVKAPDVTTPAMRAALTRLKHDALATGLMQEPIETRVNAAHTVAEVSVPLAGSGEDGTSMRALAALRNQVVPASVGAVDGAEAAVTGETAGDHDFNVEMKSHAPLVFAFVLALAFLLLLVTFRSIVVPLVAIVLNLLSVGAAYGVLVWIFQDGHLEGPLGFSSNGAITTWLPLFLFTVLFGLSMDYHVFILSRIRELVGRGYSTEEAVAEGIRSTAGTVTSAAAVMVAVFAIFASLSMLDIKQMGVGLAVAVLLDATVVRAILLPATMKLLGTWNWYLPRGLGWLPKVHGELPPRPQTAQAR